MFGEQGIQEGVRTTCLKLNPLIYRAGGEDRSCRGTLSQAAGCHSCPHIPFILQHTQVKLGPLTVPRCLLHFWGMGNVSHEPCSAGRNGRDI